tara:strand:+ start:1577 stop:2281 length:705 start_codon:yes stop_codon:yes gene_type:complete
MKKNNEKGFALVLSLVLLMAMSLMGGALIVISASDHQSNNISDEYQQTFYVAETALYEGEKYVINQFLGPYKSDGKRDTTNRRLLPNNIKDDGTPVNLFKDVVAGTPNLLPCFNSFQDLDQKSFVSVKGPPPTNQLSATHSDVKFSQKYYDFLTSNIVKADDKNRVEKYYFQYFLTQVGSAPFKGYGTSIKKDATDAGSDGMAYRIYGCGLFAPDGVDNPQILVPLESTLVLPR